MERRVRSGRYIIASGAILLLGLAVQAQAGEPYLGLDVGVAAPTEKFRQTADPGGAIAAHAGYRLITLGDIFALSVEGIPQFAFFSMGNGVSTTGRDVQSLFLFTAGPRFSLLDENLEAYFSTGGGYYRYMYGVIDDDGGGWNIAGGVNYEVVRGSAVGLFVRRDDAHMRPVKGPSTDYTTYVTAGFGYEYRFHAPEAVAEAPAPPAPEPPPAPAPVKQKLVLRGVKFDFNKATIRPDAKPILDEAVATLKQSSGVTIAVDGYTDSTGTDAYNLRLSQRRARAVADYLAAHGLDAKRMTVEGFGETHPVASNDTEEGRAQNRRVELRVVNE